MIRPLLLLRLCLGQELTGRLFIAVTVHGEANLLQVWTETVLKESLALRKGVADLRFFTDNSTHSADSPYVVVLEDASLRAERKKRTEAPFYWRDYLAKIFDWALRHSSFEFLVRSEPDAVLCIDTIYRALPSSEDWVLGFQRKCGYDDTFYLMSRTVPIFRYFLFSDLVCVDVLEVGIILVETKFF